MKPLRAPPGSSGGGRTQTPFGDGERVGDVGVGVSMDCCGGRGVTPRKEAVPKAGDVAKLAPRSARDFVAANRMQVQ